VSNLFLKPLGWIALWGALAYGQPGNLAAQQAPPPAPSIDMNQSIDALARFMVESTQGKQPTVPYPETTRPELPLAVCSIEQPLCVHAGPESAPDAAVWLAELEAARSLVEALGFPVPQPDAGRGGTFELDVYLASAAPALEATESATEAEGDPGRLERKAFAELDEPAGASLLDGATTYARVDPSVPAQQRLACAVQAIAEAGLRSDDPAEGRLATGAVAAFVAYLATGSYGCVDRIEAAQLAPEHGIAAAEADALATLQLALVLISRRHDGGDGAFIREVWQLSRQKSPSVDAMRISPSFFEALDRALENSGESFEAITESVGVARYFATRGDRDGGKGALPALPASISVPITLVKPFAELPAHLPVHEPLLGPLGSAYARIDTSSAPPGSRLDVWLRGDVGRKLVLTAVRLGADGREMGRMTAPARKLPHSFLPIEMEQGTASVLIVVTALVDDLRTLGFFELESDIGFRLIFDKKPGG
jgi:hypothetical protein